MTMVDLATSRAIRAEQRRRALEEPAPRLVRWTTWLVALVAFGLVLLWFANVALVTDRLAGFGLMLFGLSLIPLVIELYREHTWSAPPELPPLTEALRTQQQLNLADYLDPYGAKLLDEASRIMNASGAVPLTPTSLFLVATSGPAAWLFGRVGLGLAPEEAKEALGMVKETSPSAVSLDLIFQQAVESVLADKRARIDDGDLLVAILETEPGIQDLAFARRIKPADLRAAARWQRRIRARLVKRPRYDRPPSLGFARDWSFGYTPFLNQFATNLSQALESQGNNLWIHGRSREVETLGQLLGKRSGQNILLVGPTGVGKDTSVIAFTSAILEGKVPQSLELSQVLKVDLATVLAGVSDRGQIEARLMRLFGDAIQAGNIILYLPDVHILIGGGDRVGGIDASEFLLHMLRSTQLRLIASTTPEEFHARIAAHPAVANLFEIVEVHEPQGQDLLEILEDAVLVTESETGQFFTEQALQAVIQVADRYVPDKPFPQKAIEMTADIAAAAQSSKRGLIDADFVQEVLSAKLELPLQAAQGEEREQLLNLEGELHRSIVGQDEAVKAIADALRRARAGLASRTRPIASFLFLGPTGVGKTETAKTLARVYFGAALRMIRLDMSEYQGTDGLVRLLGAAGAGQTKSGGALTDPVHDQPFSLLLLDELEKAHPQVLNLFLQILDDGRVTDGVGRVIDFTNTMIIATSNAGSELIRQSVTSGEEQTSRQTRLIEYLQTENIFRPEFLNRFDGVIAFHPLTKEQVEEIVVLLLQELVNRLLAEQEVEISFADDVVVAIAEQAFDPQFGARPIRRFIQDRIESWLANQLLAGTIQRGAQLTLSARDLGLANLV